MFCAAVVAAFTRPRSKPRLQGRKVVFFGHRLRRTTPLHVHISWATIGGGRLWNLCRCRRATSLGEDEENAAELPDRGSFENPIGVIAVPLAERMSGGGARTTLVRTHNVDSNRESDGEFQAARVSQTAAAMLPAGARERSPPPIGIQMPQPALHRRNSPISLERTALPLSSVVLVEVTAAAPSFVVPWRYRDQNMTTGSGFAIDGRRILTNAHVVRDAVRIRVQRFGWAEKCPARVTAIGLECDLAVIEVVDDEAPQRVEEFWAELPTLQWTESGVPELYDTVSVIGFPTGGHTICITKGVVSRIDTQSYNRYSSATLLIAQIDAAINPGNSGGPAVGGDGRVAGVAFMKRTSLNTDNVGYIIPAAVARNFLRSLELHGPDFRGVPELGFEYQSLDNPSLRRATGMSSGKTGVLLVNVAPLGAMGEYKGSHERVRAWSHRLGADSSGNPMDGADETENALLQVGDVILRADDHPIGNDGSVSRQD